MRECVRVREYLRMNGRWASQDGTLMDVVSGCKRKDSFANERRSDSQLVLYASLGIEGAVPGPEEEEEEDPIAARADCLIPHSDSH